MKGTWSMGNRLIDVGLPESRNGLLAVLTMKGFVDMINDQKVCKNFALV